MPKTFFDLPSSPDQISANLNNSQNRRIDFSGLDFDTSLRAMIEYIQTYYADIFNDFTPNNGMMMMSEILAGLAGKLSLRGDINAAEAIMTLARSERAVTEHLKLIGQKRRRQTAAAVDVEVTVSSPLPVDVPIPAGLVLSASGDVAYELFKAPDDFVSDIVIPAGKRGIVAFALHGSTSTATFQSVGDVNETFQIAGDSILESPIKITVGVDDEAESWLATSDLIEKYGPTDKVAEVSVNDEGLTVKFGDDKNGRSLKPGQQVTVLYRSGGGIAGRIGSNQLASHQSVRPGTAFAAIQVMFNNSAPSYGGSDKESLEEAKRRGPREYAIRENISNDQDYKNAALNYQHPVFGRAVKAVAAAYTSINANLVRLYVLSSTSDGLLGNSTLGLKNGLKTHLEQLNVSTDQVEVLDGGLHPIDVEMTVVVDRAADATSVKGKVDNVIDDFFNIDKWEMGQSFYLSNLIQVVKAVDGVRFVDLYKPTGNILSTSVQSDGVAFNEVVVLRSKNISYYYDKPIRSDR